MLEALPIMSVAFHDYYAVHYAGIIGSSLIKRQLLIAGVIYVIHWQYTTACDLYSYYVQMIIIIILLLQQCTPFRVHVQVKTITAVDP